ncbi:hypothetical protein IC63_13890 [Paracoccus sphaerophysae]|uniref:Uncharacterized protein n=1 Tax=Paracoccus sphaerophysae TaxID=690417 RepID=A0A099EXV5_9RHOB|nr:hypothetical protein IC63_13890 [Paracoccus sphaerophysae]
MEGSGVRAGKVHCTLDQVVGALISLLGCFEAGFVCGDPFFFEVGFFQGKLFEGGFLAVQGFLFTDPGGFFAVLRGGSFGFCGAGFGGCFVFALLVVRQVGSKTSFFLLGFKPGGLKTAGVGLDVGIQLGEITFSGFDPGFGLLDQPGVLLDLLVEGGERGAGFFKVGRLGLMELGDGLVFDLCGGGTGFKAVFLAEAALKATVEPLHDFGRDGLQLGEGMASCGLGKRVAVEVIARHLEVGMFGLFVTVQNKAGDGGFQAAGNPVGDGSKRAILFLVGEFCPVGLRDVSEGDDADVAHGGIGFQAAGSGTGRPALQGDLAQMRAGQRLKDHPIEVGSGGIDIEGLRAFAEVVGVLSANGAGGCRLHPDRDGAWIARAIW